MINTPNFNDLVFNREYNSPLIGCQLFFLIVIANKSRN